jgi:hypothetical protein
MIGSITPLQENIKIKYHCYRVNYQTFLVLNFFDDYTSVNSGSEIQI